MSGREAADIRAHLAACARCSVMDAELADLPRLLGTTPQAPMPDSVLARIQMAIASESAARGSATLAGDVGAVAASAAGAGAPVASVGPDVAADGTTAVEGRDVGAGVPGRADQPGRAHIPGRPELPARRWRLPRFRIPDWSSSLLVRGVAATAAVVVIVGAAVVLANGRTVSLNSGSKSALAPARPGNQQYAASGSSSHKSVAERQLGITYRLNGKVTTTDVLVRDANLTRRTLPGEIRRDVAASFSVAGGAVGSPAPNALSSSRLPGGLGVSQLEGCLNVVASGRSVLVAEVARYLGTPATIIVLRAARAPVLDVVVVGFKCSAANRAIITTLTVPAG